MPENLAISGGILITNEFGKENFVPQAKILPNPNNGWLYVEIPDDKPFKIQVFDLDKQLVFESPEIIDSTQGFDLTGMPNGLYIIKILTPKNSFSKKLVLQR